MSKLTPETAAKLQKILIKRVGRELSQEELEQAYDTLIGFTVALIELDDNNAPELKPPPRKTTSTIKQPIANNKKAGLQYV